MKARERPFQPAVYVAVDFPPGADQATRDLFCAWLIRNRVDPGHVLDSKPLKISAGPLGIHVLTYAKVIRDRDGEPVRVGGNVATEPASVNIREQLPPEMRRYTRAGADPLGDR